MYFAKARFAASSTVEEIKIGTSHIKWNGGKYAEESFSWLSPVTGEVYGTVFNFKEQVEEWKGKFYNAPYNEPPKRPVLYIKPRNTINAHLKQIPVPEEIDEVEINGTLGIVIGEMASNVNEKDAFDYVEGYTIVNDVTIPHTSVHRPAIKNKARDGFCPIGPWVVKKEEIPDPGQFMIWTFKNDELVQVQQMSDLVKPIPKLLAEVTEFMTLSKGDVLLVGLPHNPPLATAGDKVRIEIDYLGSLENKIVDEKAYLPGGTLG
ncbi:fumarylacetoacetate hydrolase family protein [Ornithinibacillus halophilus]|uniref:5-carboxy-2-oxohept-3-enedioate decarboxylase HpaG1 subunit n=1 Tax=Ornithinibacillus halophilus TaxID=930117 RepID=A0A1M5JTT0_9BACI|nr:fumarylacetoacetate hydrolase family protein [Ornithinibacillus halophilus]SHG43680.1 5-carboxy-2-oxohept-3-enedioate decarboxylase HpaG1 subunit [Ornithinibacillus halophilus]